MIGKKMDYKNVDPRVLKIDTRELCARLSLPPEREIGFSESLDKLLAVAKPAYVATRVELIRENGKIVIGNVRTESKALERFSSGAKEYILLVATLGIGVDRLILKTSKISAKEAFVTDAIADALIEALCDYAQDELCSGISHVGRFSPGYADLELAAGYEILSICNAEKLLGIKVTEGGLMVPRKSVNAIIAVKEV
jgi:5-methyltetrahydrofolate--homocysteine methyltransferase